jgi:hypothetical protein
MPSLEQRRLLPSHVRQRLSDPAEHRCNTSGHTTPRVAETLAVAVVAEFQPLRLSPRQRLLAHVDCVSQSAISDPAENPFKASRWESQLGTQRRGRRRADGT